MTKQLLFQHVMRYIEDSPLENPLHVRHDLVASLIEIILEVARLDAGNAKEYDAYVLKPLYKGISIILSNKIDTLIEHDCELFQKQIDECIQMKRYFEEIISNLKG